MHRTLWISLTFALLLRAYTLSAQEPATIDGEPAVRFEESPGFYHYTAFCRTPKEFSARMPSPGLPLDKIEFGISWYVKASVTRAGNAAPEIDGRIIISPHHVRFMPASPQFADHYVDLPRGETELKHSPGHPGGSLLSKDIVVNFEFREICPSCSPATPAPAGIHSAPLEQEFALLGDTLAHFESGWRTTYRLSRGTPVEGSVAGKSSSSGPAAASTAVTGANTVAASNTAATTLTNSGPAGLRTPKRAAVKIDLGAANGRLIKKVQPSYPLEAKLVRLEGKVVLHAVIDTSGEVAEVNALSGPPLLESAAVDAVKQWQYRPYAVNGHPVDVETTIEVTFALEGSKQSRR